MINETNKSMFNRVFVPGVRASPQRSEMEKEEEEEEEEEEKKKKTTGA